jgi:stearoyl-CoA 9-desaturase NADPH oxidoreductase
MYTETYTNHPNSLRRAQPSAPSRRRNLGHRILGSGLVEALAAPHGVDRYLELIRPAWSLRDARAEITAVHHPAPDSVTLTLRPNHVWRGFSAGQYVRCTVQIDGVHRARCYSPASSAHRADGLIELTARAHPEGLVSRYLRDHAVPGMVLGLEQAAGDFVLPAERPERIALVSGGSGITPVMSMLRTLLDEDYRGEIAFLHYARTPDRVPYARELAEIAAQAPGVTVAFSFTRDSDVSRSLKGPQDPRELAARGTPDGIGMDADSTSAAGRFRGHFTLEHLRAIAPHAGTRTYVCGPPGLIDAVHAAGDPELVHSESFVPPRLILDTADAVGAISFARSDVDVPNTGATLLEQAEAAGLRPAHGCRMGICHTCTCRKLAGDVRNIRTGEISSTEDEDIQICVSVPTGSVALDL